MPQLVIYPARYKFPTVSPKTTPVHSLHAGPPPWDSQKALDQAEGPGPPVRVVRTAEGPTWVLVVKIVHVGDKAVVWQ